MKVILYIRCANQDAYAEQHQLKQLRSYANRQGYEIVKEIIETDRKGTTLDRSGIHEMVNEVSKGSIDLVLALNHSRLARRLEDYLKLEDALREHGTLVVLLQDLFCGGN